MQVLDLKKKTENSNQTFEPIEMQDGTHVTFHKDVNSGRRQYYCDAVKDGKDVGRASWNDTTGRMFLQVYPISAGEEKEAMELAQTMFQGIMQMLNEK